ncbi:MAG: Nucleotidyltransferase domain protein [Candidatus Bathyarchaeota archaeon BA2]|nr:MAG: Nucleotidyltransferase domain protein [Candidatus Bathyarchaeota archaeon BA2]
MKLRGEVEFDLDRLVKAIVGVEGVVAVILFGSRVRGDYDEYSDYDMLVVFENDEVMWRNRRKMFENVGRLGLFTQVLTRSIRELAEETEQTFLQNVLRHGVLLYLRYPFQAPAFSQNLRPMAIVSYSLKGLPHKEKVRVIYRLLGKRTKKHVSVGIVEENGGIKLGDGCFMIPLEGLEAVTRVMNEHNVRFRIMRIYSPGVVGETVWLP